ncbi:ABC transporter ATP-binding protein [Anaerovorax odorimutans]|uniref:ABC transporter ATP-binding protein n=1 Tax=Anaerovorax odorimutans TaxID=109327 RepID=UPI000401A951|nr:ABC transporter ATP-binding protein [Anaerovorax odorimutans]
MIEVNNIKFSYGKREILKDLSFRMEEGEFVCILGANGCGKTTLLKTMLGLLKPQSGNVLLYGEDIHKMDEKALAQKVAYIPQNHVPPFPFSVMDVVLMGRTPHMNKYYCPVAKDKDIAMDALNRLGILSYASRKYTELSGGQRQMVIIARAIAQQTKILIMDEPTASLDFGNQYLMLEQMHRLSKHKMSILMVTHNPDHALYCANRIIAMQDGRVICEGDTSEVISEPVLRDIYGMDVKVRDVDIVADRHITVCVPLPNLSDEPENNTR